MSRRKELEEYLETGRLRDAVTNELSDDAVDLLLDLVSRYCAPRRSRLRSHRSTPQLNAPRDVRDVRTVRAAADKADAEQSK